MDERFKWPAFAVIYSVQKFYNNASVWHNEMEHFSLVEQHNSLAGLLSFNADKTKL